MKKVLNNIENIVDEMCKGIVAANPGLALDERYRIIKRKEILKDRVTLISGGGSGHEPAHAGFVGEGMLTAAVCGDIFASPSTMQIYNAIVQTQTDKGSLLIIKNYSGDCMNFDLAAEMAEDDDVLIDRVYVNDDIAVEDSLYTVGRRGVAGTVLVHKIAGAAAAEGRDLAEVKRLAEKTTKLVKSIGVALTSCTVPAKGSPTFVLADNEIEYGVGIHGEPGIERQKLRSSKELAVDMVDRLLPEAGLEKGNTCVVMVNGLGATPLSELYIQYNDVARILGQKGVEIYRAFVGNYMTSLDMSGFSITLMKLDDELKSLLDAPADTAGMKI
ncbi:MAG: dihydroxyacetone kinase subunit DhaK [Anaerovoracaceae bacterium]